MTRYAGNVHNGQVAVLIPSRVGDDPARGRALEYVLGHYVRHHPGWKVSVADSPGERFHKGVAVSWARYNSDAEVLVVSDADVFCDPAALTEAVTRVTDTYSWALPHYKVWRLNAASTSQLLDKGGLPDRPVLDRGAYTATEGGGLTVVRAETYDDTPMDPRYHGWGDEDYAFGWALNTLHGPCWRGEAQLWHLHHEHVGQPRGKNADPDCRELTKRYRRANGNPTAMRQIIDEAKANRVQVA